MIVLPERLTVGFTGTKEGMTNMQARKLHSLFEFFKRTKTVEAVHHGDCVGADRTLHFVSSMFGFDVIVHPPDNPKHRANCDGPNVITLKEKPYLDRNKDIVDCCNI